MIKSSNWFLLSLLVLCSVMLFVGSQRQAAAYIDGPCPDDIDYSSACPSGSIDRYELVTDYYDCGECDPFWANGQKYYHCATYRVSHVYCVVPPGPDVYVGVHDYFASESGGSSTCYPNLYGTGIAGCLAN